MFFDKNEKEKKGFNSYTSDRSCSKNASIKTVLPGRHGKPGQTETGVLRSQPLHVHLVRVSHWRQPPAMAFALIVFSDRHGKPGQTSTCNFFDTNGRDLHLIFCTQYYLRYIVLSISLVYIQEELIFSTHIPQTTYKN